ncbi:hypothetical protein [Alicyclobacillus macrosporangiidus]|uniref:hypothetical protein n=1 Tax=Alicyclobacillus macrosporangiidus TaxID=392015 RepID=UPI001113E377|nr:hypothetical protein [Alicyclobacillus macrosporangiidus]
MPGLVLAVIPLPKQRINALTWVWRKARFKFKPQIYRYDLSYRELRHRREMHDWLADIADAAKREGVEL